MRRCSRLPPDAVSGGPPPGGAGPQPGSEAAANAACARALKQAAQYNRTSDAQQVGRLPLPSRMHCYSPLPHDGGGGISCPPGWLQKCSSSSSAAETQDAQLSFESEP